MHTLHDCWGEPANPNMETYVGVPCVTPTAMRMVSEEWRCDTEDYGTGTDPFIAVLLYGAPHGNAPVLAGNRSVPNNVTYMGCGRCGDSSVAESKTQYFVIKISPAASLARLATSIGAAMNH